jgi:hypothetical protein
VAFSGSTGQKASGEGVMQEGTTSWNIADGFTKINVLKPLIEINLFEELARFGYRNGEECMQSEIPYKRVEGFDRLMFSLRQIISNCMFQIDTEDKTKIKELVDRIDLVESVAEGISTIVKNDVTKEEILKINEEHFRTCLDSLSNIKEDLHFILNRAGLIFRRGEETDIDEFMKSVYEG